MYAQSQKSQNIQIYGIREEEKKVLSLQCEQ